MSGPGCWPCSCSPVWREGGRSEVRPTRLEPGDRHGRTRCGLGTGRRREPARGRSRRRKVWSRRSCPPRPCCRSGDRPAGSSVGSGTTARTTCSSPCCCSSTWDSWCRSCGSSSSSRQALYQGLTMYLLLAIGWHGGEQLAGLDPGSLGQGGRVHGGWLRHQPPHRPAGLWRTLPADAADAAGRSGDGGRPLRLGLGRHVRHLPGRAGHAGHRVRRLHAGDAGRDGDPRLPGGAVAGRPVPPSGHGSSGRHARRAGPRSPGAAVAVAGRGSTGAPGRPAGSDPGCCTRSSSTRACTCSSAASSPAMSAAARARR